MNDLIDAMTLAQSIGEVVVLDARYTLGRSDGADAFARGHVPGARWVDVDRDLAGPPGEGGRHPLPEPEAFAAALRRLGVDAGADVVACDGGDLLAAGRLWWMLSALGGARVRVLDGGYAAWAAAGLAVETGPARPAAAGSYRGERHRWDALDAAGVVAAREAGATILDVRAAVRFRGESEPIDPIAGHIPGALNRPAAENFAAGRLRERAELAELWADARADDVLYCGSGLTAAQTALARSVAGVPTGRLYAGSWSDWITDPGRGVATGGSEPAAT